MALARARLFRGGLPDLHGEACLVCLVGAKYNDEEEEDYRIGFSLYGIDPEPTQEQRELTAKLKQVRDRYSSLSLSSHSEDEYYSLLRMERDFDIYDIFADLHYEITSRASRSHRRVGSQSTLRIRTATRAPFATCQPI